MVRVRSKKPWEISESQVTPQHIYMNRRQLMAGATAAAGLSLLPGIARAKAYANATKSPYSIDEDLTSYDDVTGYNNFYEFGTGKKDPARLAHSLTTRPWSIKVTGECARPGTFDLEDLLKGKQIEERIYRLRCVEAWSMVVPWNGFPMSDLLSSFEPTTEARFVQFETLVRRSEMVGVRRGSLPWPYVEGLRMDEAMHPLTLAAVGLYGDILPNQNGAPIRLVVPWKYGFKSIKSIVGIRFTKKMPKTTWNEMSSREYGFYANVNPAVDHPRWSQKSERRIGDFFRRPTLMFNGYQESVGDLYAGMNLARYY